MRQFVNKTNQTYKRTLQIKSYHKNIIYKSYITLYTSCISRHTCGICFFEHCIYTFIYVTKILYAYKLQNIYDCRFIGTYITQYLTVLCTLYIPIIYYTRITLHPPELVWANRSSKSTRRDQQVFYTLTHYIA